MEFCPPWVCGLGPPLIATSVLSMRWYHLWSLVPNLDFSTNYWRLQLSSDHLVKRAQFMKFVDRVLFINKVVSSVRTIRLQCLDDWKEDYSLVLNDWIHDLVTRQAEIFDLELPFSFGIYEHDRQWQMYSVPESFFNQRNLVVLKLENVLLKVPSFVCFPSLETISLVTVLFLDDDDGEALKNLMSGCLVLKSMCISNGFLFAKKTICICSTTLRELELNDPDLVDRSGHKVVIDAPNLRIFCLRDEGGTDFNIVDVSSLAKVSFTLRMNSVDTDHTFGERLLAFLQMISKVKELFIAANTIQSFEIIPMKDLPMFEDLIILEVELIGSPWWPILPRALQRMPNLSHCVIMMHAVAELNVVWYDETHELPQCLLSSIESVKIRHYDESYVEMGLVRYILKHAIVLKRLSIQAFCLDLEQEAKLNEELQTLQRSSSACVVELETRNDL